MLLPAPRRLPRLFSPLTIKSVKISRPKRGRTPREGARISSPNKDASAAFHVAGYEILRRLATGGMGSVYVARKSGPLSFSKLVAIKRLHPHLELDEESGAMRRFGIEARIGAQLRHPNIVDVLDFGRDDEGVFIVMEYVHGVDLAALMRARAKAGTPGLAPSLATRILSEVLRGLQAAHELRDESGGSAPVVHRDLGPRNVLLSDRGEVKITDFGIALILEGGSEQSTATRGTFAYMSPEQARGEALDVRSDLYSCGILLYEMLAGRRAMGGGSAVETLERARDGLAPEAFEALGGPSSILRPIVEQALAVDREQRYASAAAFRADLDRFLEASVQPPSADDIAALVGPLAGAPPEAPPPTERRTAVLDESQEGTAPTVVDGPPEVLKRRRGRTLAMVAASLALLGLASTIFLCDPGSDRRAAAGPDGGVDLLLPDRAATGRDAAPSTDISPKEGGTVDLRRKRVPTIRRRARGWLAINTIPVWSTISVDGKRRGTTPKRLRLTAGVHRVTLRALGKGRARTFKVSIRAGATTQKVIRISRPAK